MLTSIHLPFSNLVLIYNIYDVITNKNYFLRLFFFSLTWSFLTRGDFPPGDIWQCLETFGVDTNGAGCCYWHLVSRRPGILFSIPQGTRYHRLIWSQTLILSLPRSTGLEGSNILKMADRIAKAISPVEETRWLSCLNAFHTDHLLGQNVHRPNLAYNCVLFG